MGYVVMELAGGLEPPTLITNQLLYQTELRQHKNGADDEDQLATLGRKPMLYIEHIRLSS